MDQWHALNKVHRMILTFVLDKQEATILGGFSKTRPVYLPALGDAGMMTSDETLSYLVDGGWLERCDGDRFRLTKKGRRALE
jgi:hypothetical protein